MSLRHGRAEALPAGAAIGAAVDRGARGAGIERVRVARPRHHRPCGPVLRRQVERAPACPAVLADIGAGLCARIGPVADEAERADFRLLRQPPADALPFRVSAGQPEQPLAMFHAGLRGPGENDAVHDACPPRCQAAQSIPRRRGIEGRRLKLSDAPGPLQSGAGTEMCSVGTGSALGSRPARFLRLTDGWRTCRTAFRRRKEQPAGKS